MGDATPLGEVPELPPGLLRAARGPAPSLDRTTVDRITVDRMTALVVLGAGGTEATDFLAPWAVLAASGAFDVYSVAAQRAPRLVTGRLSAIPDFAFEHAPRADLVVVPALADPAEPALPEWLRARAEGGARLLSICEGARVLAAAGLLDGRTATTHFFALDALSQATPEARFVHGHRYVSDGPLISSAGVSAAVDASLYAVERWVDRATAEATAGRLGIRWLEEEDPEALEQRPPSTRFTASEWVHLAANTLFRHREKRVGVLLYDGIDELGLAAAVDTSPRTLRVWLTTLAADAAPIRSRRGLALIADRSLDRAGPLDLLVVPAGEGGDATSRLLATAAARGPRVVDRRGVAPGSALDRELAYVEAWLGPRSAAVVAKMLEYPRARWRPRVPCPTRFALVLK